MRRCSTVVIGFRLLVVAALFPVASPAQGFSLRADSIVRNFVGSDAPGCAVAIDSGTAPYHRAAFGNAEMEYRIPVSVETIFEAGSVSKQFTAAAVLLLAARNQLDLDAPIQRWFPGIPEYQSPVTVRHLMLHTSGLRDWGSVRGVAGWPRWTASYTHDDALEIISRQRGLNHEPGAAYSYTNTGYNLMAMLVERVAGESLQEFTRREFFVPLGMTHTSWRDDYMRVVPGRAQAYSRAEGGWRLDMPFEHVYGNGGLLTTVGDLMIWNHALAEGRIGSPEVSAAMQTSGVFNDGRPVGYGGGLSLNPVRGVAAVSHTGSTAGYRAVLARFTDSDMHVAILCNRGDANPQALALAMLDGMLPFAPVPERRATAPGNVIPVGAEQVADFTGTWLSDEVGGTLRTTVVDGRLVVELRPGKTWAMQQVAADSFSATGTQRIVFLRDGAGRPGRLFVSVDRALGLEYVRVD